MKSDVLLAPGTLGVVMGGLVVAGFLAGTIMSLQLPDRVMPQAEAVEGAEAAPADPLIELVPERRYIDLRETVTVSFPHLGGTLVLGLGLAMSRDLSRAELAEIEMDPTRLLAPLAELLLEIGERVDPAEGFAGLRAQIPEAVALSMNDQFEAAGQGRPVLDVLILQFSIGG